MYKTVQWEIHSNYFTVIFTKLGDGRGEGEGKRQTDRDRDKT